MGFQTYALPTDKIAKFIDASMEMRDLVWHFPVHLPDMKAFLEQAEDTAYDKIEKAERAIKKAKEVYINSVAARISRETKVPAKYLLSAVGEHSPHPDYAHYAWKEFSEKTLLLDYGGCSSGFPDGTKAAQIIPYFSQAYADIFGPKYRKIKVAEYVQENGNFSVTLNKHNFAPRFHIARKRLNMLEQLLAQAGA